jgi:hypothetical protein
MFSTPRFSRRRFLSFGAAGALALWSGAGCNSNNATPAIVPVIEPPLPPEVVQPPNVRFTDITDKAGIRFHHVNGARGKKLLPETMGAGVAFLDYDNDGRQDILFVNSCYWPGQEEPNQPAPTLALYRNKGDGTFEDVTKEAGLAITMYGMGVTAGDYDNDGYPDLFITGVGGNRLFRNVSDGKGGRRFVDVTAEAGVGGPGGWPARSSGNFLDHKAVLNFSSSAAWLDYDGDGRLDLFVCNYVAWSPEKDIREPYTLTGKDRAYGPPTAWGGTQCFLYRNLGGGKFEDVSAKAGIPVFGKSGEPIGKSLGVIVCDVDDDGWPDIVVANDTVRNFFFHNKGDGTFEEIGEKSNVAYALGDARGAMGIDCCEYRPARCALLIANFANEPDTFLRQDPPGSLSFVDAAIAEGIAGPSRSLLKFGVFFFDYDLDGRQDLLSCNGHLEPEINKVQPGQSYKQPVQLFWNSGGKRCFAPVGPEQAGPDLFMRIVGRGCAFADIDGDGDLDVVLTENGGPARLLRNDGGNSNHWIRLVLQGDGVRSNRSAIGARVTLEGGGTTQHRQVVSGRGYLSQSELPLTFGLGRVDKIDRLTIQWPGKNGGTQVIDGKDLAINKMHIINQK